MGRRGRGRTHAGVEASKPRGESAAKEPRPAAAHASRVDAALPGGSLPARPLAIWLILAGIAALVSVIIALAWPGPRFDMVKTLASIAAKEGAWDNPWDLQPQKIASLKSDLGSETDPIKRLIT